MLVDRLRAQLLSGPPAADAPAVAERLLAIQAQDGRGARLAIRARSKRLTAADVDRSLTERALVITWLNRGTLHLVRSQDYPWLHALTAPTQLTGVNRRLRQLGVSEQATDRGVRAVERALSERGPLTRAQLADHLERARVPTVGQALIHLLFLAAQRGVVVRGPVVAGTHAYALARDWLGPPEPVDRDAALAELARRYLAGHGPAGERDLARWAGLPLRDARAGLAAIAGALSVRADGLVELATRGRPRKLPSPRLLGAFEPVLLGWCSREQVAGRHEKALVAGGMFLPFALVNGRAAGTWRMRGGQVEVEPFGKLQPADAAALERDARAVERYLEA